MNPILDIFAAAQTNASPTPVGAGISGQTSGEGLFSQLFADAVAATPQQTLFPVVGLPVQGLADPADANSASELTGYPILTHEKQVVGQDVDQILAVVQSKTATGDEIQVLPQHQTKSAVTDEVVPTTLDAVIPTPNPMGVESQPLEVGTNIARMREIGLWSPLSPIGTAENQESLLTDFVEGELSLRRGEKANGVVIKTQVEVSDEAAKVIAGRDIAVPGKASVTAVNEEPILGFKPEGKPIAADSHSLKSHLRKAFPDLNIESATGKANVQVKLTNTGNEAQTKVDLPISTQNVGATNGLPIAVAPQIATAVLTSGHAARSVRITRQTQTVGTIPVQNSARTVVEGDVPVRLENQIAIRKPVQVALKSQGFDFEKLASSEGSVKDPLAENIAIDKSEFKVTSDKQIQQATDRSLELNGTERFKLDIKRGHIEALLKKGEIKLQLQPEHLGHLKIKLATTPTEVTARMETSSEDAKRAVELSLPQLRESFERAGLKLNSIEVSVNDDSDTRRQHAYQHEWRGGKGRTNSSSDQYLVDVPAMAEISQNSNTVYRGALNLVA